MKTSDNYLNWIASGLAINRRIIEIIILLTLGINGFVYAQSPLAYEGFNATTGALNGKTGGTGWASGWTTQNGDVTIPGYNVVNTSPLTYSTLTTSGSYAIGGTAYLSSGRAFDVSATGPFASYLTGGNIGASGKTLYVSALLRKTVSNTDEVSFSLHANSIAWYASPALIAVGYFGSASETGGVRYWSLRIGGTVYKTNTPITIGQAALLALKIDFAATSTVNLYVNPSSLGGATPVTSNASGAAATSLAFKSFTFYGGNGTNQGALDEIRLGETFASVTPSADVTAPSVPAGLASSAITATSLTLSWTASTDNTGVTGYEVFRNGVSVATPSTNTYNATGLTCATAYTFTVRARDAAGNWSAQSSTLNATTSACPDTQAPSIPTGLTASAITTNSFALSWTASIDNTGGTGVNGYEVFNNGISVGTPNTTTLNVTGLSPSTTYALTVRARDVAGNWSAQSAALNVTTQSPAPVGNLLAFDNFNTTAGALHGNISGSGWAEPWTTQNGDVTVPGYNVANTSMLQFSTLATSGNYAIGGNAYLTTGRGLDITAGGPFSSYLSNGIIGASGKTLYASALLRKTVSNTDEVSISFHGNSIGWLASPALISAGYFGASSENGGVRYWSIRIGSTVYRSNTAIVVGQAALLVLKIDFAATNTVTLYVNPSTLGGSAPTTPDATATTTASVAFRSVAFYGGNGINQGAIDEIRVGESYSSVTPTGSIDTSAPSVPTALTSSDITQSSFTLSWAASTDNIGVTGYEVFRNGISVATPSTNSYNATGLTCATAYSFTVRARDGSGNWSAQSSALSLTTSTCSDTQAPTTPAGLASSNITMTSVTLSWIASTDNVAVTGYEVFRNGVSIATPSAATYNATGLTCGTAYSFTVRARDAAGNWSAQSSALNVTTSGCSDTQAPSVPTGLSSSNITSNSVTLSWTASTDNAGGSGVNGYEVFRDGTSAGTTASTSLSVAGLQASTAYSFTVRARDVAGNWSAQSSALSVTTSATPPPSNRVYGIGINTNGPADYNIDKIFADAIITHRQWNRIGDGQGGGISGIPLDSDGWPMQDGTCLVYHGLTTRNNHGTYKFSFNGQADISVTGGGASFSNKAYNSATNTSTADLIITDSNNMDLWITFNNSRRTSASATNTGVTNLKLMRPVSPGSTQSYPTSKIIGDDYINKLAPYKVVRYMGWSNTNWCPDVSWSTHTSWNYATENRMDPVSGRYYTGSWEAVILISNAANKDAWITLPHKADDDYILKVAQMFKYGSDGVNPYTSPQANPVVPPLNPNLKLYVEYSNEVWNNDFSQTGYTRDAGRTYGAPLNFDGETDVVTLGFRYKAMRTVQISNIFRSVFGDGPMPAPGKAASSVTVRPVIEWQLGYNDLTHRTLSFIDRYYNKRDSRSNWSDPHPVNYYIYGGGGSGYWYTDGSTTMTSDNLWNNGSWNPSVYTDQLFRDAAWAKAFGLAYLAYEGDNHPSGAGYGGSNNDAAMMTQTHWDSRMYNETLEHLQAYSGLEGEMFCFLVLQNVTNSFWGTYNMYGGLDASPQYQVIQALNGVSAAPVSRGSVVPFTRPGGSYDVATYESPNPGGTGTATITANTPGLATGYTFRTNSTGTNNVRVEYSASSAATLVIEFAGTIVGTFNVTSTGGAAAFTPGVNISCSVDRLYSIRLVCTSGSVVIRNVIVGSGASAGREALVMSSDQVDVYPNQVDNEVNVTVLSEQPQAGEVAQVQIVDMMRKTVQEKQQCLSPGYNTINLQTEGLSDGMYFMVIQKGNSRAVKRIIVCQTCRDND